MSDLDTSGLDEASLPRHVGIILDGNGRWAEARGLPRTAGHQAGEEALFDTIEGAIEIGLEWLSVYTFSTENWSRSEEEVTFLMFFNEDLLLRRRDDLDRRGVRIRFAGELDDPRIPERNRKHIADTEEMTAGNDGLNLVFAFNYGGRGELVHAAREIARLAAAGKLDSDEVDAAAVAGRLWVPEMPDADLIIRTSGEQRISNFLLWQGAYAELVFTPLLWPDFRRQHLVECIAEFQGRTRRFGA